MPVGIEPEAPQGVGQRTRRRRRSAPASSGSKRPQTARLPRYGVRKRMPSSSQKATTSTANGSRWPPRACTAATPSEHAEDAVVLAGVRHGCRGASRSGRPERSRLVRRVMADQIADRHRGAPPCRPPRIQAARPSWTPCIGSHRKVSRDPAGLLAEAGEDVAPCEHLVGQQ